MPTTAVSITVQGCRERYVNEMDVNGILHEYSVALPDETFSDTIELDPEEYKHLLKLLAEEINTREKSLGHITRMHSDNDITYRSRHEELVDLLMRMDI